MSIRPGQSSTGQGLLIGYKLALLRDLADETMLPGLPQEPKEGWLDKSRWLRTAEEVNLFWDIVTGTAQKE